MAQRAHRGQTETTRTDSSIRALTPKLNPKTRSVSPGGRSIERPTKVEKHKKKMWKVPEKYEKILDGIVSDSVETADLCNAGKNLLSID